MIKVAWLAPYPIERLKTVRFNKPVKSFGTGTWLVNLSEELAKNDYIELHIITETSNISLNQDFIENNIHFHLIRNNVPFTKKGYPSYFPIQEMTGYFFNVIKINRILRRINPDLVHAQGTENSYAIAATSSKFPNVISIQGVMRDYVSIQPSLRMKLKAWLEEVALKKGRHFIHRTNFDSSLIDSVNFRAVKHIVYEAMNPVFFGHQWACRNENTLLFVGSIQKRKGISTLFEAIVEVKKIFPDVCLTVIGNGNKEYIDKLKSFCSEKRIIENVRFLGYMNSELISEYHLRSQILICPSLLENSPNSVAEAMVSGMPVIASKTGGIPSMIVDNETGILVEPENGVSLAEKIIFLLNNPFERERLGNNGLLFARARYLPLLVSNRTIDVYRSILNI